MLLRTIYRNGLAVSKAFDCAIRAQSSQFQKTLTTLAQTYGGNAVIVVTKSDYGTNRANAAQFLSGNISLVDSRLIKPMEHDKPDYEGVLNANVRYS